MNKKRKYMSKRRFNISRRRYNDTLTVKRLVVGSSQVSFNNVATQNFWRYNMVQLDNGFANYNGSGIVALLTNLAEYQTMFNQYKLSAFKITFRPRYNDINANQGDAATYTGGKDIPYFCINKDPFSRVIPSGTWGPTSLNTLLEDGGKIYRADRPVSIYMKPWITEQYGSGATRFIKPRFTDNDASGASMSHRGFHLYAYTQNFNASALASYSWDVYVTYYLQFKNVR